MKRQVLPEKRCEWCGVVLTRRMYASQPERVNEFLRRRFCGRECSRRWQVRDRQSDPNVGRKHAVRAFAKRPCQECGRTSGQIHRHHVNRDTFDNRPENVLILCNSCHGKLHWREDREARLRAVYLSKRRDPITGRFSGSS